MREPLIFPLDLDEVRRTWITEDRYGRLCGESRLFGGEVDEAHEALRQARLDIRSLVAELDRANGKAVTK